MRRLILLGADGLMTDRPDLMQLEIGKLTQEGVIHSASPMRRGAAGLGR